MPKTKPQIRKVKKYYTHEGGGGSHGNWKIAYADFVTAMMAFFLLMWLISISSEETLQGLSEYFSKNKKSENSSNIGINESKNLLNSEKKKIFQLNEYDNLLKDQSLTNLDKENFKNIIQDLLKNEYIKANQDSIFLDITSQGLRIQITDSNNRPMFKPNSDKMFPYMEKILFNLSDILSKKNNFLSIEGHTRKLKKNDVNPHIDVWKLSSSRANEVRKYFAETSSQMSEKILQISGNADTDPLMKEDPYSEKNIRISLIVLNQKFLRSKYKTIPSNFLLSK